MSADFDDNKDFNQIMKRNSNEKHKDAKKTFKLSFDVEKFLDLKITELDVAGQLSQEVAPLSTQLRTAERKQKEISRLFTECEEQLQQFQESLSLSPTPEEDSKSAVSNRSVEEVIIDDSDEDDIVFIEATKPSVSRRKTPALFPNTATSAVPAHSLLKPVSTSYQGAVVYSTTDAFLESPPTGSSPKMIQLRAALTAKLNEQTGVPPQHTGDTAVRKLNTQEMIGPPSSTKIVSPKVLSPVKTAPASAGVLINGTHYGGIEMTVGMKLLGKKFNDIWYKGTLTDIQNIGRSRDQLHYRVKFDGKGLKILTGRNLAYWDTPEHMIKVGSRVVAMYRDEDTTSSNSFYAGIVAEPLSVRNNHRLLVFFDDGYAQYCTPGEIHKVCEQSVEVWRDIHPDSQDFIREYLKQYPERPMVRLQKGQVVKTEWNGRWWTARVIEVDASLAKMFFDADKRTEWIYRGSTRLEPLYTALCKAAMASEQSGKARRNNPASLKGAKKPFVEYMRGAEEEKRSQMANAQLPTPTPPTPTTASTNKPALNRQVSSSSSSGISANKKRSVAKKSTGGKLQESEGNWEAPWLKIQRPKSCEGIQRQNRYQTSSISNQTVTPDMASVLQQRLAKCEDTDIDDEAQGERTDITNLPARDAFRRKYEPHACSRQCNEIMDDDPKVHRGSNPLLIPMLCGWERQITKTKPLSKRLVMYRAPCGRRFRNIDEVDKFLFDTECNLTIDLFCFDPVLHTDKEFVPVKTFCDIKDLSYGKETVPISCVNGIDRQYPDYVEYSNQRTPCQGVSIPLDPNFLVCCDCTDGCQDKSKCACCQMTIEASGVTTGGRPDPSAGYQDRRLKDPLLTGIYECNSQCKCDSRCHNRVAQNGLALRLQVFKTENRGWGLRCLDDIPCGGFLCIYAGQLLTEQGANEDGQTYGDEYLAELDYMEVVERHKEGYESDIPDSDKEEVDDDDDDDDDVKSHNSDSDFDGGELDNSKSDIQELRTLPARNRGSRMKNYSEQSSTKLGKLILRRDSGNQEEEWSIKHHKTGSTQSNTADKLKEMSVKDGPEEITPPSVEQHGDSDELPDLDTESLVKKSSENVPKESRVKNLPDPSKSYVRAHRSMVSAHHKPSKDKLKEEKEEPLGARYYFHDGQQCYVMDAKSMGNIGRYLNHSCSPNVFVQNVFVDTHDLRFPWVAFFASKYIRQGTELTWDYNYEVGSVPGKILYCYCGSAECRGRLL